jgi:hypothetical protein
MSWFRKGPDSGVATIRDDDTELLSRSEERRMSPPWGLNTQGCVRPRCALIAPSYLSSHEATPSGSILNAEFHPGGDLSHQTFTF